MSEPTVDRDAWARLIAELVRTRAKGNKAAFARMVDLKAARTVDRWLAKEVNVNAESVRKVANGLGLSLVELLAQVGYIKPDDESMRALAATIASDRAAIAYVRAQDDLPSNVRSEIEASLVKTVEEHERALMALAERMVDLARRTGGAA